jgi:hypothetical protein
METSFGRKFVEQQKKLKYKENNWPVGWLVRLYNFHYALVVKDC